jgi:hypothetical protein
VSSSRCDSPAPSRYSHGDQMGVNLGQRTGEPRHNGECVDQGHPSTQMPRWAEPQAWLKITPGINTTPGQLEKGGEHARGRALGMLQDACLKCPADEH